MRVTVSCSCQLDSILHPPHLDSEGTALLCHNLRLNALQCLAERYFSIPDTRSWDLAGKAVDLDLQAVVVDDRGCIVDAVYYNNMKAIKGCITHSGDEQSGQKDGLDEIIWVNLPKLPDNIRLLIFVVAAFSGGSLRDAQNGKLHVLEGNKDSEVARFPLEQSIHEVDAVASILRKDSGWQLQIIDEPAREGRHFIDILEPVLGNIIRGAIPGAPKRQKVAFAMEKASVVDLPQAASCGAVQACLGWDVCPDAGVDVDLDVSAVVVGSDGCVKGAVFFGELQGWALTHSGDNLTGEGDGDDEVITANLQDIPVDIHQIVFIVNVYTRGVTFEKVSNAYCRILDSSGEEMARYVLREGRGERGLIMARLFRENGAGERWGFQALGSFCRGQTWKDSVPEIQALAKKSARELQMRSGTMSFAQESSSEAAIFASPIQEESSPKSGACHVM
ncbi:terZ [Symbiodinium natans]|uniref:TerZ protein n=1 Tax=Symbiodinium natans TaxID=878477 RepID=A0A812NDW6_9DINO|nr:terZ [Symbiodinium natans]